MYDYHIHSDISGDSGEKMEVVCEAAKKSGLKEICFTEHIDVDFPFGIDFMPDLKAYAVNYEKIKGKYPGLAIKKGLEVGLMPHVIAKTAACIENERFDFIIASQHVVCGEDPYAPQYFEGKTVQYAFEAYFGELHACLKLYDNYSVIGHLGVLSRSSPQRKPMGFSDYPDRIDAVLQHVIQKGKGIEVNTAGYALTGDCFPSASILKRYRELKGEIITVGSDAHMADRVGNGCAKTIARLKELGFKYVCTFKNMEPIFNTI